MSGVASDPLVYSDEVQRMTKVGPRTIFNWIEAGVLPPPMKIRNRNVWFQSDLEKWRDELKESAKRGQAA